jgi:CheY-like chemotaxis protein
MQKILVIDDDVLVRDTIVRILERKGYQVLVAGDGARGLRIFRSERPDLVITDIIMPEKEGLETIREIRGESRTPRSSQFPAAHASATWIFWTSPGN